MKYSEARKFEEAKLRETIRANEIAQEEARQLRETIRVSEAQEAERRRQVQVRLTIYLNSQAAQQLEIV